MPRSDGNRFTGGQASIGSVTPMHRVAWRTVVCPVERCQAPTQAKCRRRVSEKFTSVSYGVERGNIGEGRWEPLLHPHPERVRLAKGGG